MPRNRALWVVLTHWRDLGDEFEPLHVLTSDHVLLSETQVILSELAPRATSYLPATDTLGVFENGFVLGKVVLPERAVPGENLHIAFDWRSQGDSSEDYIQFLHFGHEKSGEWWVYDQHPLGARLPTRLWYRGLADSETWAVPLPADLAPGRYAVYTGLYRLLDQERASARSVDGEPRVDARVRLGDILVER